LDSVGAAPAILVGTINRVRLGAVHSAFHRRARQIYGSDKDRRRGANGIQVRVIEYTLDEVAGAEPIYRLLTSILDPDQAPAEELAAL